ncbi:Pseudouridine synthase [Amanita muscaria]
MGTTSYENWTREDFISRITQLESQLAKPPAESSNSTQSRANGKRPFDFSAYPKRKIALKFCYSGWEYNGLAYQPLPTPLPTVESVLFDALVKSKLIDPDAGFDGCGWEKCGRTDRGVSAAGQVVSLWTKFPPEHNYVSILNRLLPCTIRVLAWSPVSPTFSARFSCRYRHYKYFFSRQGLDVDLMRAAASRLIGEHDFRNLCKLDPAKQLTVFKRTIVSVSIEPLSVDPSADVFVFNLVGSAFLYHQVRHIMAILFLVGSGLEHPSVVTSLLNVTEGAESVVHEGDPPLQVVNARPEYQMADALPLMLWECGYRPEDVHWQIDGHHSDEERPEHGGELLQSLDSIYSRSKITCALNQHFLDAAARYHHPPISKTAKLAMHIPLGGGTFKRANKYTPLLDRVRMDPVDVVNERWRNGKGLRREERKRVGAVLVDDDE